jgi:hypothetical protein
LRVLRLKRGPVRPVCGSPTDGLGVDVEDRGRSGSVPALLRQGEHASALAHGIGECTLPVAEEARSGEAVVRCFEVDRHEGSRSFLEPSRRTMDRPSHELLARAGLATLEWVWWFNYHRLLGSIGHVPPVEYEEEFNQHHTPHEGEVVLTQTTLRRTRGGSIPLEAVSPDMLDVQSTLPGAQNVTLSGPPDPLTRFYRKNLTQLQGGTEFRERGQSLENAHVIRVAKTLGEWAPSQA